MIEERLEIADTVEAVRRELEGLVVRGLQAAGPADLARLEGLRAELERAGARHLSGRLQVLLDRTRGADRAAPSALMDALSTLRVFERVLTLDTVAALLDDAEPFDSDGGEE